MDCSITQILYEWLLKRRIISDVAAEMRLDGSTLAAKLRPKATQARLTADELIPLCQAIRKAGPQYSKELDGILGRFSRDLFGAEPVKADPTTLLSNVFELSKGMGELLSNTEQIVKGSDPSVIRRLQTLVSAEILPVVAQLEALLDRRLKKLSKQQQSRVARSVVAAKTSEPNL